MKLFRPFLSFLLCLTLFPAATLYASATDNTLTYNPNNISANRNASAADSVLSNDTSSSAADFNATTTDSSLSNDPGNSAAGLDATTTDSSLSNEPGSTAADPDASAIDSTLPNDPNYAAADPDASAADSALSNDPDSSAADSVPPYDPNNSANAANAPLPDDSPAESLIGSAATPTPAKSRLTVTPSPAAGKTTVTPTPLTGRPMAAGTTYTSDAPIDGHTYIITCVGNPNYCLCIEAASRADGANLHTYKKNGSLAQLFTLKKLADGSFVLYNYHSDKVISAEGKSAVIRANAAQRSYSGAAGISDTRPSSPLQEWLLKRGADGSYYIRSKANDDLNLQIQTGYVKNKQNVRLYTKLNSKAQKFIFEEVHPEDYSGQISLRPKYIGYMAVGSESKSAQGSNLRLEIGVSDDPFQIFSLVRVWGSFYKIVQMASSRVVDVQNGVAANAQNVHLYNWNSTNAQLWQIQKNSDGTLTFRSRINLDYTLDMAGRSKAVGTNLQIYKSNGTASQMFVPTLFTATFPENVSLTIASKVNTDRVFTAATSRFMSYDYSDTAIKKFKLQPVSISGSSHYWFKIVTTNAKVIGVSTQDTNAAASTTSSGIAASPANRLALTEQRWTGADAQLWHPQYMEDGTYIIRSALNPNYVIDLKWESEDYRAYIQLFNDVGSVAQRWHLSSYTIKSCKISAKDHDTVTLTAKGANVRSDDKKAYLFAVESYEHDLAGKSPITSVSMAANMTFTASLNKNSAKSLLNKKFYVAVKYCNIYRIVSNAYYITNPEAAATNTARFPSPARGTKKGLKLSISDQDIAAGKNLRISYACIDIILDNFLSGGGYPYTYEGKRYEFSSEINHYKQQIRKYNEAGIVVTANIYLLTKKYPELLQPEARNGSRLADASSFAFNTRDAGRKRVEALFACIAEAFTTDGCMVANWGFGNEVNEYICFYYTGQVSYNCFHESLAEGYRMFNACVKSRWANARCYLSLDHNWNVSWPVKDSYMGMDLVKDFNTDLTRQGRVHWDMAMHPYPAPEQDPRFWNRSWTVTDTSDTQQITMLNLSTWAVYLKMTYGTDIHIILNETGLSSNYNGTEMLREQAAALALTYYLAEFDRNIDTMEYHRNIDDPGETKEGWHLGLYYKPPGTWDYSRPKPSANVFRYMDSSSWDSATRSYVSLTGRSSWSAWVPAFDPARFAGKP